MRGHLGGKGSERTLGERAVKGHSGERAVIGHSGERAVKGLTCLGIFRIDYIITR